MMLQFTHEIKDLMVLFRPGEHSCQSRKECTQVKEGPHDGCLCDKSRFASKYLSKEHVIGTFEIGYIGS